MSKVISLKRRASGKSSGDEPRQGFKARWGEKLEPLGFCPVSSFFLKNYSTLLGPNSGLSPADAMLVIHILDHKWDDKDPFPTVKSLAAKMGVTPRSVRKRLQVLESLELIQRIPALSGGPNRYRFTGLIERLERLMAEEMDATDAKGSS